MNVSVIGGGGHAKVVVATIQAVGGTVEGIYDDSHELQGTAVLGVPVRGPIEAARAGGLPLVIGIGSNTIRRRLAAEFGDAVEWGRVVHPRAWVHESVRMGAGSVVFAGAIVQPDTIVGAHVIINTGATVDHDGRLGDFVHVAPGVNLAGNVTLEDGVFLGIGAAAVPGVTVGAWARVGAGGIVVCDLPPAVTAVGVPARPRL
jgi:sugar O-acyltransferase (sialic acid O-acetyltransferase NeuD family)